MKHFVLLHLLRMTLLFVVSKGDLKVIEILVSDKELTDKIAAYRQKIATLQPDYEKDAKELYGLLIEPPKVYVSKLPR